VPGEGLAACDYMVMVSGSYQRPRAALWQLGRLRNQLLTIRF
jgi:hypothetical protein